MLYQEEDVILDLTRNTLPTKATLKLQHLLVGTAPEVLHQQAGSHGFRASRLDRTASSAAAIPLEARIISKPACPNIWCMGMQTNMSRTVAKPDTMARPPRR